MKFTQLMTFVMTSLCVGFNAGIYTAAGEHSRPMTDADALKHFAERFKTACSASAGLTPISESDHVSTLLRLQHGLGQHICANNDRLFYRGYGERTREYEMGRGIKSLTFITNIDEAIKRAMRTLQTAASTFETAEQGAHCMQTLQQPPWYQACLQGQKERIRITNETLEELAKPDYLQKNKGDAPSQTLSNLFTQNQYHAQKCINTLEYNTTPKPNCLRTIFPISALNPALSLACLFAIRKTNVPLFKWIIRPAAVLHYVGSLGNNCLRYQEQVKRYNKTISETNRYH